MNDNKSFVANKTFLLGNIKKVYIFSILTLEFSHNLCCINIYTFNTSFNL